MMRNNYSTLFLVSGAASVLSYGLWEITRADWLAGLVFIFGAGGFISLVSWAWEAVQNAFALLDERVMEARKRREILDDPGLLAADLLRYLPPENARIWEQVFGGLVGGDAGERMDGFQWVTRGFAAEFFAGALNDYPYFPVSIRRIRGVYRPEEQMRELQAWLIANEYARRDPGPKPAYWMEPDSAAKAAVKLGFAQYQIQPPVSKTPSPTGRRGKKQ